MKLAISRSYLLRFEDISINKHSHGNQQLLCPLFVELFHYSYEEDFIHVFSKEE